jgi:hypothetical protein
MSCESFNWSGLRSLRHGVSRGLQNNQGQKIIRAKVGVLELAKQLGNVSQACKMMGYSRDSSTGSRSPILKNRVAPDIEDAVVALAIEQPAWGIAFRKKIYWTIGELQKDLDETRPHQGRYCFGKTLIQTFLDARAIPQDKQIGEQSIAQLQA